MSPAILQSSSLRAVQRAFYRKDVVAPKKSKPSKRTAFLMALIETTSVFIHDRPAIMIKTEVKPAAYSFHLVWYEDFRGQSMNRI